MERRWVDIENIHIGSRLREPDMNRVAEIAKSISEIGLMNPPAVRFVDKMVVGGVEEHNAAVLIVGHHRLLALKKLGKESVECDVYNVDPLHAELMEIDENLARAELSPAEEAMHIKRRKEIWEDLQKQKDDLEKSNARNSRETQKVSRRGRVGEGRPKEFAAEVASVVSGGRNPESVKRDVQLKIRRAEELGSDLTKIAGTSLDKGVEMDALIKMKEPERKKIIERAAKGEQVSARPQPKKFEPENDAERLAVDLHKWVGTNKTIEFSNRLRALSQTDFHAAIRRVVEA